MFEGTQVNTDLTVEVGLPALRKCENYSNNVGYVTTLLQKFPGMGSRMSIGSVVRVEDTTEDGSSKSIALVNADGTFGKVVEGVSRLALARYGSHAQKAAETSVFLRQAPANRSVSFPIFAQASQDIDNPGGLSLKDGQLVIVIGFDEGSDQELVVVNNFENGGVVDISYLDSVRVAQVRTTTTTADGMRFAKGDFVVFDEVNYLTQQAAVANICTGHVGRLSIDNLTEVFATAGLRLATQLAECQKKNSGAPKVPKKGKRGKKTQKKPEFQWCRSRRRRSQRFQWCRSRRRRSQRFQWCRSRRRRSQRFQWCQRYRRRRRRSRQSQCRVRSLRRHRRARSLRQVRSRRRHRQVQSKRPHRRPPHEN